MRYFTARYHFNVLGDLAGFEGPCPVEEEDEA